MPQQTGVELIAAERARQIEAEGFTAQRDDMYRRANELALAATYYAFPGEEVTCSFMHKYGTGSIKLEIQQLFYPAGWSMEKGNKSQHPRIKQLVIAGALIAAEIDRELRAAARQENQA